MKINKKNNTWLKQEKVMRNSVEIVSSSPENSGIIKETLSFKSNDGFTEILSKLKITLIVTREYENMIIALKANNNKIAQSYFPLPHPSGIAIDKVEKRLYVAATRNPNQIVEFSFFNNSIERVDNTDIYSNNKILSVSRKKFFPGCFYLHDLVLLGGKLFANSVGTNSIIEIDLNSNNSYKPVWFPKCVEDVNGNAITNANYIQLNSIAAGETLNESFFSASADKISKLRPGFKNFPVNKKGVIFSGKTREPIVFGLTRPHSARLYKGKLWLDNSGYGEFGYVDKNIFCPVIKFPGWTRGLCFIENIAFIGVSNVLPKFKQYAPGIKNDKQICSIFAFDIEKNKIVGEISFPFGNQIFGIEYMKSDDCNGFLYKNLNTDKKNKKAFYYKTLTM